MGESEKNSNGDKSVAGMALSAAKQFGPSAVMLAGLLWWLTQSFSAKFETHDARLMKIESHIESETQQGWMLVGLVQELCVQNAQDKRQDWKRCLTITGPRGEK